MTFRMALSVAVLGLGAALSVVQIHVTVDRRGEQGCVRIRQSAQMLQVPGVIPFDMHHALAGKQVEGGHADVGHR